MRDILTLVLLLGATGAFAAVGLRQRSGGRGLDDYLVARGAFGAGTGAATLLATVFGAWLLFSPAEAATWGGGVALIGYAAGVLAPRLCLIPLGLRVRRLVPHCRSLPEFVQARYGTALYVAVLFVMVGFLAVSIAAEATATARVIGAISGLPPWLPAGVTLAASVIYTATGGLRASIVTDRIQMAVIIPFLLFIMLVGGWVLMDPPAGAGAAQPLTRELLIGPASAWQTAAAIFLAILFTGLLHQGSWQRVFAMDSSRAVVSALAWSGLIAVPVVLAMGCFGLIHQMMGLDRPSAAVFAVLTTVLPDTLLVLAAVLAVALVLSTMDTALNALASLVIVALRSARPAWPRARLVRISIAAMVCAAAVALYVAVQGWSVLYLFLCADLLCAAAAVPVFAGLFIARYSGGLAAVSLIAGLIAGLWLFPGPDMAGGSLLGAFVVAFAVPLVLLPLCLRPNAAAFDLSALAERVRPYPD